MLFLVFSVLVGINVYVFFFSKGSLKQVQMAAQQVPDEASAPTSQPVIPMPPIPSMHAPRPREGAVREREGLGAVLRREGLSPADTDGVLRALQPVMNFKKDIRAGQKYVLRFDGDGKLSSMELKGGPGTTYRVGRSSDGRFVAQASTPPAPRKPQ